MISQNDFRNQVIDRSGQLGRDACQIMAAAIQSVDPYQSVVNQLHLSKEEISIAGQTISRKKVDRIFLLGFGKAAVPMAKAVLDTFQGDVTFSKVITKDRQFLQDNGYRGRLEVLLGGHPVPTKTSIEATQTILEALPVFSPRDLALVVISGGGSALFTAPMGEVTLEDLRVTTEILIRSGAEIQEINAIRKHIDRVKGGRLAARLAPARVRTLILSDVIGDQLDMIASGPTVPDPTTYENAWQIIEKYKLIDLLPDSIKSLLQDGRSGTIPDTLKEKDLSGVCLHNHLIATNLTAALAARDQAENLGYHSLVVSTHLTGLTENVAELLTGILKTEMVCEHPVKRPFCLIFGGETTVHVTGDGLGGRNQDLVLRMVPRLVEADDVLFISLATDGEDGPTDAAGAASDAKVFRDGTGVLGLNIDTYINTNNSYEYLEETGALIRTGSTGTNVNDLVMILAGKSGQ